MYVLQIDFDVNERYINKVSRIPLPTLMHSFVIVRMFVYSLLYDHYMPKITRKVGLLQNMITQHKVVHAYQG